MYFIMMFYLIFLSCTFAHILKISALIVKFYKNPVAQHQRIFRVKDLKNYLHPLNIPLGVRLVQCGLISEV